MSGGDPDQGWGHDADGTARGRVTGDPVTRSRTAVLAERIPIRRIVLVTLSILIAAGVLLGS